MGTNTPEFDAAAQNRFIARRFYFVDGRMVVTRRQLVLQNAVERIGTAFDRLEPEIDSNNRSERARSGYFSEPKSTVG